MKTFEEKMSHIFMQAKFNLEKFTSGKMLVRYEGCRVTVPDEIDFPEEIKEDEVSGVGMTLMTSPAMSMLMLFPQAAKHDAVNALLGCDCADDEDMKNSIIQEIGNIFGSALANGISHQLNEPVSTSPPEVSMGVSGNLLLSVLKGIPVSGDNVMVMDMMMNTKGKLNTCTIHLFFNDALQLQISSCGQK